MAGISHRIASDADARAVIDVHKQAANDLTARFGRGHWSVVSTLRTVRRHAKSGELYVVERETDVVATFKLSPKKIGFYRKRWFVHPDAPALYLTHMAVRPDVQREGIGRWIMGEIETLARRAKRSAIRFDAYDSAAGAGGFYVKCGYVRVHCSELNGTPLEYYEKELSSRPKTGADG